MTFDEFEGFLETEPELKQSLAKAAGRVRPPGTQTRSFDPVSTAAGLGALAGAVVTPLMTTSYDMGIPLGVKGFIAALIGGLNKIEGVIVGGFLIGIMESFGAGFIHSGFKDAIPLVIFLAILYFRRGGLLGGEEAGKV